MSLQLFALISFAIYAFLQFYSIPKSERALQLDLSPNRLSKNITVSVLSVVRGACLMFFIASLLVMLIMYLSNLGGNATTIAEVASSIDTMKSWKTTVSKFGVSWGIASVLILLLSLLIYAYRQSKIKVENVFDKMYKSEFARLEKEFDEGRLTDMETTPPIAKEQRHLEEIRARLEKHNKLQAGGGVDPEEIARLEKEFDEGRLTDLEPTPEIIKEYEHLSKLRFILENPDKVEFPENIDPNEVLQKLNIDAQLSFAKLRHLEIQRRVQPFTKEEIKSLKLEEKRSLAKIKNFEIERRIKLTISEDEAELPKPVTFWDKLQTFFISKGLMNNLGRTTRLVYLLGLLLLIPSLLSVYSGQIGDRLSTNIVQLEHLQLDFSANEVDQEYQKAVASSSEEDKDYELSEEDEAVVEEVATLFESSLAESYLRVSQVSRASRFSLRSNIVKNELLRKFAQNSRSVKQMNSGSSAKNVRGTEKTVLKTSENLAVLDKEPRLSDNLRKDLRKAVKKNPSLISKLRGEMNSFQAPVKRRDISRALVKQTFGTAISDVADNELGKFVSKSIDEFNRRELAKLNEIQSKRFATKIVKGESLGEAINSVKASAEHARIESNMRSVINEMPIQDINNKLRQQPPAVQARTEPHVRTASASQRIENLSRNIPAGNRVVNADALGSFDDWFPSQQGVNEQMPRNQLQKKLSPHSTRYTSRASTRSFTRARSFTRLRGFSRVGGVLIGQDEPLNEGKVDYQDFSWKISGDKIQINLIDQDGKTHVSQNYKVPLAYYALNYASDGRPLAVTMVSAPPMRELKILLHPTLIDNPLGYRMIELDRFVDQFTGDDMQRRKASELVYAFNALYKIAWASRAKASVDNSDASALELMSVNQVINSILEDDQTLELAKIGLSNQSKLGNASQSPLAAKTEFYDVSLVNQVKEAATNSSSINSFISKIKSHYGSMYSGSVSEYTMEKAFKGLPDFQIWSGVRELKYSLDPEKSSHVER